MMPAGTFSWSWKGYLIYNKEEYDKVRQGKLNHDTTIEKTTLFRATWSLEITIPSKDSNVL